MPGYDTNALALAGGVGGAKLALGLAKILDPDQLTVVVNTGDDEIFYGLHVSPDLDTVMYTLAGIANPETGWGITGETFNMLERLTAYGEDTWFGLGDKDLATHIRRTNLLNNGESLSEVTSKLAAALGVEHAIVPMTDDSFRTIVDTEIGSLAFQDYFVKHRSEPKATAIRFDTNGGARPSPGFGRALSESKIIVFCPSNPYLSVAPNLGSHWNSRTNRGIPRQTDCCQPDNWRRSCQRSSRETNGRVWRRAVMCRCGETVHWTL